MPQVAGFAAGIAPAILGDGQSGRWQNHAFQPKPPTMERVTGIGGRLFRASNPETLAAWYEDHPGVSRVPADYSQSPWLQQAGPTVLAPFAHESDYFGSPERVQMINFRVRNLDATVGQLRAASVEVVVDPENYRDGRFAHLHDPEGNPIELWEPKRADLPREGWVILKEKGA